MPFDTAGNAPPSPPLRPDENGARWCSSRRFGHRHRQRSHGIIPGLVLVAWGGLLLLREVGVIDPAVRALDFWPLVLVGLGISIAAHRRGFAGVLVGIAVALLGAGMIAQRLGYGVPGAGQLWPLAIIAAGLVVIWNGLTGHRRRRFSSERVSADDLHRSVTMGELALAIDSQQFRGGTLSVTMGEIRVDLRRAAMPGEETALDLSLTMGSIELQVPSNWQVVNDIAPFGGSIEDRTEPRPDGAGVLKRLVLRGKITMGAVTVTN